MKRVILPVLLLLLFVSESVFVDVVPFGHNNHEQFFAPHFFFVLIMFIAIYQGYLPAMIFGFIFGMLFDIVYTGIIGVFAFSIPVIAYMMSKLSGILQNNIFVSAFLSVIGIVLLEFFVYGLNLLIGFTTMPFNDFSYYRLLPTVILNSAFVVLTCFPFKKLLDKLSIDE